VSYELKKTTAVIQLTADVATKLVDGELVVGTPTVTIEPAGELTASTVDFAAAPIAKADFSAGNSGDTYLVIFSFTTDAPRTYKLCQSLKVI